ncbi:unnamed protein product [Nippostrongylus brasiliensis]|uniref:BPTI/Kunitz inhibitor domain-containing protein n=1 Tax=Nippostrongylus brasiliensis TaxID=27835 RepID=A0A0N4Y0E3_NIPBR|nr:unnamed protein product [Nippostrongylus brasiliensis]
MKLILLLVLFSAYTCFSLEIGRPRIGKKPKIVVVEPKIIKGPIKIVPYKFTNVTRLNIRKPEIVVGEPKIAKVPVKVVPGNHKFTNVTRLNIRKPRTAVAEPKILKGPVKIVAGNHKFTNDARPINRCVGPHTEPGPACMAMMKRYTFDPKKGCVEFEFGGCRPAPNNFETLAECRKACIAR